MDDLWNGDEVIGDLLRNDESISRYSQDVPRRGHVKDITKKVKVDTPEFDGTLNLTTFLDWLGNMRITLSGMI